MGTDINSRTIGGLIAFYEWLKEKHYLGPGAVEAHKTAIKMVFGTVEPDGYEAMSLADLDLEDIIGRFRVGAGSKYRAETLDVYARRIRKAIEAHQYYLEHGRPPTFRQHKRKDTAGTDGKKAQLKAVPPVGAKTPESGREVFDFAVPLSTGVVTIPNCPRQLPKADADRFVAMIRALQVEEQRQIPRTTGESAAA
jgi:hypothetical protein